MMEPSTPDALETVSVGLPPSTNRVAVSVTYIALGVAGIVIATTGWWDSDWAMSIGLLGTIALLFWHSAAFRRGQTQPDVSPQMRRERVTATLLMCLWGGGWFIWAFATDRHTETDGLILASAGLLAFAWGCWRLRESLR